MRYRFREDSFYSDNVKLEFYDKKGSIYELLMEYDVSRREWFCEYEGDVDKYKFVVNDIIRLNDPAANVYAYDSNWEVWSIPSGDTRSRTESKLGGYVTADRITNSVRTTARKTEYVYDKPLNIYTGVLLQGIAGLHSVTYICYQPDGNVYMIEEDSIGQFETGSFDYEVVFKNRISRIQGRNAEGTWLIQIYLDGKCIVKDYIMLKRRVITNMISLDYKM